MPYTNGFPVNNLTATSLSDVGENKSELLTITNGQVQLTYKPIVKAVDPTTGKTIPSTIRVRLGSSSNDSFTEVYSLPVIGKHFMYTEVGGNPILVFDTAYNDTSVTVTYLAKGDYVSADLMNNITADLSFIETNMLAPDHTGTTPTPSTTNALYKIIVGQISGSGELTIDLSTALASVTPSTILAFPVNVTSPANDKQVAVDVSLVNKTVTFTVSSSSTINYMIYVYNSI